MAECEYYKEDLIAIPSREIRRDRNGPAPSVARIPWCTHPKHSPVDEKTAYGTVGAGNKLECEGDRGKCRLSTEQFEDV